MRGIMKKVSLLVVVPNEYPGQRKVMFFNMLPWFTNINRFRIDGSSSLTTGQVSWNSFRQHNLPFFVRGSIRQNNGRTQQLSGLDSCRRFYEDGRA